MGSSGLPRRLGEPGAGPGKHGRWLVGRDGELDLLAGLVGQAGRWRGGAVLVVGEAGIGKSALVAASQSLARSAGMLALGVCCLPTGESLPLDPIWSLLRQLSRLGTPVPAPPPPAASQEVVAGALFDALEHVAGTAPLLVGLDDLHWASAVARQVLHSAIVRLGDLPIAWVLAGRPTPEVEALARRLLRAGAGLRRLAPLEPEEVALLFEHLTGRRVEAGEAERLQRRTGGNPLLCSLLARPSTVPSVPPAEAPAGQFPAAAWGEQGADRLGMGEILADWLDHLDPGVVAALRAACVLPEELDEAWLTSLVASTPAVGADLAGLEASGLIARSGGATWRFRHPLIREALYGSLPATERARRHAEAASVLSEAGAPAHLLAPQLSGAGRHGEAARAYLELGDTIYSRGGGEDAIDPYRHAEELSALAGDLATCRLARAGLSLALLRAGRREQAAAAGEQLLEELSAAGEAALHLRVCSRLGLAMWDEASDLDSARRLLDRALRQPGPDRQDRPGYGPDLEPGALAEAELAEAVVLDRSGEALRALGHARAALSQAEAAGDRLLSLRTRNRIGLMLGETASCSEGISVLEGVAREAEATGLGAEAALAALNLSYLSEVAGDVEAFARHASWGLELPHVPPSIASMLHGNVSFALMNQGDLDGALAHQLTARSLAARAGPLTETRVVIGLAHVHLRRGDLVLAGRLLDGCEVPAGSFEQRRLLEARGLLLEEGERPAEARHCYDQVASAPDHPGAAWCLAGVVRTSVALGEEAAAARAVAGLATFADRWPGARWLHMASKGWLAVSEDGRPGGVQLLAEAAAASSEAFERQRLLLEAARRSCDPAGVLACVHAYEEMGARRAADRARHLARRLGARVGHRRADVGLLTRREHEIALLAASGQRNDEIASLLYLSERTVERHMSNVLAKLGLRSRVQLAALVAAGKLPG